MGSATLSLQLFNRTLRTRSNLLRPDCESHVFAKQASQKTHHDCHAKIRSFTTGQAVMVRDL